jgi:hypothetical protein
MAPIGPATMAPSVAAINTLRLLNQDEQAVVPKNGPPRRWRPYVFDDEKIDRTYYELCVLSELSFSVSSRLVSVLIGRARQDRPGQLKG